MLQPTFDFSNMEPIAEPKWGENGSLEGVIERAEQLSAETKAIADAVTTPGTGSSADSPASTRRNQVEQAVRQLRIQSVVSGSRPLASINRRPYGVDDVVEVSLGLYTQPVKFKILTINKDSVKVRVSEPEHGIRIETIVPVG